MTIGSKNLIMRFRLDQHIYVGDTVQFINVYYKVIKKITKYTGHHGYDKAKFQLKRIKKPIIK